MLEAGKGQALKKISNKTFTFYHEVLPTYHKKKPQTFSVPILNFAFISKEKNVSKLEEKMVGSI